MARALLSLEPESDYIIETRPPALLWAVAGRTPPELTVLWLLPPTCHRLSFHSSPSVPSGSPQLCGVLPSVGIQQSELFYPQDPEGPIHWNGRSLDSSVVCLLFMEEGQGIGEVRSSPRLSQWSWFVTSESLFTSLDFCFLI